MERPPGSCVCAAGVTLVVSFMVAGMSSGLGFGGRVGKIQAAFFGRICVLLAASISWSAFSRRHSLTN